MNWVTLEFRIPAPLHEKLKELVDAINAGQNVPISLNELAIEALRNMVEGQERPETAPTDGAGSQLYEEPRKQTLHQAIVSVLSESHRPLTFAEVRSEVIRRGLYLQKDGGLPSHQQIRARIENYANLFTINRTTDPQTVSLRQ